MTLDTWDTQDTVTRDTLQDCKKNFGAVSVEEFIVFGLKAIDIFIVIYFLEFH